LTDIEAIADVVQDVWERDILLDVCEAQLECVSSALWVATDAANIGHPGEVVGFASAFLITDAGGCRRWEVDLVAVREDSRGQGLGTHLINRVCEVGKSSGVSMTRALIRTENVASQRAFERAGFTTDSKVHQLVLWTPRHEHDISRDESEVERSASIYAGDVALLPVDTLTYRGLWIEGMTSVCAEEQRLALKTAHSIIAREHRDNTGALIPVEEASHLATDLREEGVIHGEYHWFVKPAE
jgi:GNAT superfamily N-acetyltransferase